jgi:hypothetical protein
MRKNKMSVVVVMFLLLVGVSQLATAQITANGSTPIVAVKAESLSIAATGPLANFDLDAGDPTAAQALGITTTWSLTPQRTQVQVCIYMSGPMTGTGGNPDTIPEANVRAGGASINAGPGCGLATVTVVSTTALVNNAQRKNGSVVDSVNIDINAFTPLALMPDTYTGTINLVARAIT